MRNRLLNGTGRIRFHEVTDGEIAVADASVVLEMILDSAVGLVVYDRSRRLAAASKLDISGRHAQGTCIRERTSSASLAMLTRMQRMGCDLDRLEVYALGSPPPERGPIASRLPMTMAVGLPDVPAARRVEFDVGYGRIVVGPAGAAGE